MDGEIRGSLLLSALTAAAARGGAIFLNVVCVPLLLSALGTDAFGALMATVALASFINLATLGLNGDVTSQIAEAGEATEYRKILARALRHTLLWATPAAGATVASVFIGQVAGARLDMSDPTSLVTLAAVVAATLLTLLGLPAEAFQLGQGRPWVSNIYRAAGSAGAAFSIYMLARVGSLNQVSAAVALTLPLALTIAANGILTYRQTGMTLHLLSSAATGERRKTRSAAWSYALMTLQAYTFTSASVALVGMSAGSVQAGIFSVYYRVAIVVMSLVTLVTTPVWPMLLRASVAQRLDLVLRLRRYLIIGLTTYAAGVFVFFVLLGPAVLRIWTGGAITIDAQGSMLLGALLSLHVWNHLWAILLISQRKPRFVGVCMVVDCGALLIFYFGAFREGGAHAMLLAMVCALSIWSAFALPITAIRTARTANERSS